MTELVFYGPFLITIFDLVHSALKSSQNDQTLGVKISTLQAHNSMNSHSYKIDFHPPVLRRRINILNKVQIR